MVLLVIRVLNAVPIDNGARNHVDVGGALDLGDEVVGHAGSQRGTAHYEGVAVGEFGEVERGLPGGVRSADDVYVLPDHGCCLYAGRALVDAGTVEPFEGGDVQPGVGHAGGD